MNFDALLKLDHSVSEKLRFSRKRGILKYLLIILAHSGDTWLWLLIMVLSWFLGGPVLKQWAIMMLVNIMVLALILWLIKMIFRRRRPQSDWGGLYRKTDPHSFPSGHAARCFFISVITVVIFPVWATALFCLWATAVSLARIMLGVHYVSDMLAGTLLGIIFGIAGVHLYNLWLIPVIS